MKYEGARMKKKYCLLILSCMLYGCSAAENQSNTVKNDANKTYCAEDQGSACSIDEPDEKDSSEENKRFKNTSMKDALSVFQNKETAILYFGYPDCPWCKEAMPILGELADENNQQVLYIRTRDDEKELLYTEAEKKELISYTKDYMQKDEDGKYQLYVPFVVFVKDGEVVNAHIGTVAGHDAHERTMTAEEEKGLRRIYDEMFHEMEGFE